MKAHARIWRIAGIVGGGLAGLASHMLLDLVVRMNSKAPLAFGEAVTNWPSPNG